MIKKNFEPTSSQKAGEGGKTAPAPQSIQKSLHNGHFSRYSVLVIGTETGVFRPGSEAHARIQSYGMCFSRLDLIVLCRRGAAKGEATLSPNTHAYGTLSRSPFLFWLDTLRIARKLSKADVVTVQDPFETGLLGYFLARRWDVPLHVQVHTDFLSSAFRKHSLRNRIRVYIARFVLKHACGIRVVSERIKDSMQKARLTSAPIEVLPIYINIERFRSAPVDDALKNKFPHFKTRVLIVSRLEKEKNVAGALESFAASSPRGACLIVVGEGRERHALQSQAKNLGIGGRVFFEGRQDSSRYYPIADVVLAPSMYEGYGMTIIEALAAGKPVLATDVGVAREAGAIVATEKEFPRALLEWFKNGPRIGILSNYPYENFEAYVRAYCDDIAQTRKNR